MNYSIIRYILSSVVCFEGVFLALPSIIGAIYGEEEGFIYGIVSIICILAVNLRAIPSIRWKVL